MTDEILNVGDLVELTSDYFTDDDPCNYKKGTIGIVKGFDRPLIRIQFEDKRIICVTKGMIKKHPK